MPYILEDWPHCLSLLLVDNLNASVTLNFAKLQKGMTTVDRCLIKRRPKWDKSVGHFFRNSRTEFGDLSDSFIGRSAGGKGCAKEESITESDGQKMRKLRTF